MAALAVVTISAQPIALWVSTGSGLTTDGTVNITNSGSSALTVAGDVAVGDDLSVNGGAGFIGPIQVTNDVAPSLFATHTGSGVNVQLQARSDGANILHFLQNDALTSQATLRGFNGGLELHAGSSLAPVLTMTSTALTPHVRIETGAAQPRFFARNSATDTGVTAGSTIQFDLEVRDVGNNYDTGTSTFTAPVTGIYELCAQVTASNVSSGLSGHFILRIVTSNRQYDTFSTADAGDQTAATCVPADLDAGDTAFVQLHGAATADIYGANQLLTRFSGELRP